MTDDLLALLIEVTSVGVAGKSLKKPIEIPRPKAPTPPETTKAVEGSSAQDKAFKKGVGVLAASSKAVSRQ